MGAYILFVFFTVLNINVNAQTQLGKPKKIVLLIGQSNMSGRANLISGDYEPVPKAFLLDSMGAWTPLKNPLNIHSSIRKASKMQRYSLGYSLAQQLVKEKLLTPLGFVVNARGGSQISQWIPGTYYYEEAVKRSKIAMSDEGEIIGVFWLQGESNLEDNDPQFNDYFTKLKSIIYGLRKDLNNDQLIFIASELNKDKPQNEIFKKMLGRLNSEIPHAASIKSKGTSTYDGTHFDHNSLDVLGNRFAEKFKELNQK